MTAVTKSAKSPKVILEFFSSSLIAKKEKEKEKERRNKGKDKDKETPIKSKKSVDGKQGSSAKESKEESKHQRRGSKAVAPPPVKKKSTLKGTADEGKRGSISVDVSKFVKEFEGDFQSRYEEKKTIGQGAYGEVKMVLDKVTKDIRAMKVIPKASCAGVNSTSIMNEIQMLKTLDHPSIIKIYEFYHDKLNYYLITEYCSGGELYDRIIKMKNFSEVKAALLMKQILSAVAYCHKRKIVHRYISSSLNCVTLPSYRDIKPENLLFESPDENANIKVIDFGTSAIFGSKKMRQKLGTVQY